MTYTIENTILKVRINSKGSEITSIHYKNKELLWQANVPWQRHAPILFPIVGKLNTDRYLYQGKLYSLPQHGFARDKEWVNTLHTSSTAEFELTDDEDTFIHYPFHFSLITKYELLNTSISITYTVFNPYHEYLPFSIGFHPAFNTFGKLNTCYLKIYPEKKSIQKNLLKNGLISQQQEIIPLQDQSILPLHEHLFENDAIVLQHPNIKEIKLCSDEWDYSISIHGDDCIHWGIWTKNNCSEFICIEPWMGIADEEIKNTPDIIHKKDIILLPPYQTWTWRIQITIH